MRIYLQEISASMFLAELPQASRVRVQRTAELFEATLNQVQKWWAVGVPPTAWICLWQHF